MVDITVLIAFTIQERVEAAICAGVARDLFRTGAALPDGRRPSAQSRSSAAISYPAPMASLALENDWSPSVVQLAVWAAGGGFVVPALCHCYVVAGIPRPSSELYYCEWPGT